MEQIYDVTIKLIRYVLNGDVPELPGDIDFELLFEFGKSHGVENMLHVGLRDLGIDVPEATMEKFKTAYEMQIMVEATQQLEYECLCDELEKAEIDFLPLKGIILRNYYPMPDLRKSGDVDILARPEDRKRIKELMIKNGYAVDKFDEMEIHDGYRKPPYMLIEVHNRLVEKSNRAYAYYSKIWDEVTLNSGAKHGYKMSKECFYAFIVAHLCKHIKNEGAGIKFICDIWILNKIYRESFDEKELNRILKDANIADFEKIARGLAEYWFDCNNAADTNIKALEKFVLESGCFGTIENHKTIRASEIDDSIGRLAKYRLNRIINNVFVPYSDLKRRYPILKKYCILLPIMWIVNILAKLKSGKTMSGMVNATLSVNVEEARVLSGLWKAVN